MKFISAFISIIFICDIALAASESCEIWLGKSSIKPSSLDCELQCSILPIDLSTFMCHDQCQELCRPKTCHPTIGELINQAVEDVRPLSWPNRKEKIQKWSSKDKDVLIKALQKVPLDIWPKDKVAFLRFDRSIYGTNPSSSVVSSGDIAFYDTAFSGPIPLERIVVHELAHFYYQNLGDAGQSDYKMATRWWASDPRPGEFVEEDGRNNPEEDFANNMEYMAFNPARLLSVTPAAHTWFKNRFGANLSKGNTCNEK